MAWIVPFLTYWFVLFVVSYILVEYGSRFLYGEEPKMAPVRVAVGSLLMAIMLTWTRSSFETMFTADLKWTVLQAMLWVGVFILVYSFHPIHGLTLALVSMVLVAGMATIAVETMTSPAPDPRTQFTAPNVPIRRAAPGSSSIAKPAAPAPAPAPAK